MVKQVTAQAEGPVPSRQDNEDGPPLPSPPRLPLLPLHPQPLSAGPAGETEAERSFVSGEVYKWIKASSILLIDPQVLLQDDAALLRRSGESNTSQDCIL